MLRKITLTMFLLIALAVVAGAIAIPPIQKQKSFVHTFMHDEILTEETYERYWELLRFSQWGVTPYEAYGCGGRGGMSIYRIRLGFFSLTQIHRTTHTKKSVSTGEFFSGNS